ncbi:catechol O-methyltransferase [Tricharina praecox]|uniref:catechol O-methyltransferase n=1 Tax=Tricharina praecox TaxID=43433 RepID=UPI002220D368|nr:catechol O-methyltransferase [Tricharina praecox]KAI5854852.1 catechol O-methyltransferase [Tricharina praecox]
MPEPVSFREHVFKNVSLVLLSLIFLPLDTLVVAGCLLWQIIQGLRRAPTIRSTARPQRTVMVTAVAMGKGLALARAFHQAGHRVIGVDFDTAHYAHSPVPSSGRFSQSLDKYFTVTTPHDRASRAKYSEEMVRLVKSQGVDLWLPVSGVASTIEDALLKAVIEKETNCKVFQPDPKTCEILHDKYRFIQSVQDAGLTTPVTVLVESQDEVFGVLLDHPDLTFIVKCVELDDVSRADMTKLPQPTPLETEKFVHSLDISPQKRWVVQQFVRGKEFCTHAVVVRGKVKAFVACPSSEMLMHYSALSVSSPLSRAMLAFTRRLARTLEGGNITGQLSFDFLVDARNAHGKAAQDIELFPIECNPRTHTAVILLATKPKHLAATYLTLLDEPGLPTSKTNGRLNGQLPEDDTDISTVMQPDTNADGCPASSKTHFYWLGHDLITGFFLPILSLLAARSGPVDVAKTIFWFAVRALAWNDATFRIDDPCPWWWLYHVYYPWMFVTSLATGKRWSRVNTSTTRVFESY